MKKLYVFLSKILLPLIYDKKYLCGKWFGKVEISGWKWAWRCLWAQKIKGYNRHVPFPVHPASVVGNVENLEFNIENIDNFWKPGNYYQCWRGKIRIGKGTWIAQNVGIITENHNLYNISEHDEAKNVEIGENCWIGMNAVILPGVHLGDRTIVGAGAIVTKSFSSGHCVIVGNPAKKIKDLN